MCGIVGIFQERNVDKKTLDQMTDALAHRGPDDRGIFIDGKIGLGQRRLSILDLSPLGHQPMHSKNKRYSIVFNGEIYNFKQIRRELEGLGYKFVSESDTEVILSAFEQWGAESLVKFNGMFAFIIYDKKKHTFFVARDRLGIKPLYYLYDGNKLLLASEIKAFLKYPTFKVEVDPDALNEYFTFQNILSDHTLFKGVKILKPGHYLEFDGKELKTYQWWDVPLEKKVYTKKQWEEKVVQTFKKAIKNHLVSDVEVGSFLSGGMDSATITTLAAAECETIKTFTGGFDLTNTQGLEATFDERANAESVARQIRSEHYELVMHSGSMQKVFKELIWHLEDLRVGMCYPNYMIANLVSKFVKVVLSGAGGDELFGGYVWRYKLVQDATSKEQFDKIYYDYWSRLIKDDQKSDFFDKEFQKDMDFSDSFEQYRAIIAKVDDLSPVEKALYFEIKTFLHGLFVVEDKVSMAHSIEVRVPFLDSEMIELAASMPYEYKIDDDTGKVILRDVMKQILPQDISEKRKMGFSPPQGSWYRDESLGYVKEMLLNKKTLERGFFNPKYIEKIIDEHVSGEVNHRLLIWSLLSFEWWCRIFLDGGYREFENPSASQGLKE